MKNLFLALMLAAGECSFGSEIDLTDAFPPDVRCVYLVAPSSLPPKEAVVKATNALARAGYKVKVSPGVWTYAPDGAQRARYLETAWKDPETDLILCARGGRGGYDTVTNLDFSVLRSRDVPFVGFSNISCLMNAFVAKGVGRPISGPMCTSIVRYPTTRDSIERLSSTVAGGPLAPTKLKVLRAGGKSVTGRPIGGHWPSIGLMDREWLPSTDGRIVFLEINKTYSLEKAKASFLALKGKGYFENPAAVVLCDLGISGTEEDKDSLVRFLIAELRCPVFQGYPYGHVPRCYAIDYARTVEISPDGVLTWESAADAKPLLRLGVMTDTHVGETVASCGRVRLALELFKAQDCELVINNGDIADWHYPSGYEAYRQVFDDVFAGGAKPQEIYVYAWHDAFAFRGHEREMAERDAPEAFDEVRRILKAPNGHTETVRFKDYSFVVFPQFVGNKGFIGWDEYEKRVADACAANPGKPVFVVDHIPAGGIGGSDPRRTEILSRFPQVVYFCGHAHASLRSDLRICQTDFTVIHAGCLQDWGSGTVCNPEPRRNAYGVLTVDVFPDRLLVRRWDVRDRSEIKTPWIVPLPFEAATAPWRREVRRAEEPVPAFATGAEVVATAEGTPFKGFRLRFPSAGEVAYKYRIDVERRDGSGAWTGYTWREALGDWWLPAKDRKPEIKTFFEAPFFTAGDEVRFVVVPQNQYGVMGASAIRSAPVKVPAGAKKGEVVLESDDPAKEFGLMPRNDSKGKRRCKVGKDGWYGPFGGGEWVLRLPEGLFSGKVGTRYRVTFDCETEQPVGFAKWNLRLSNAKGPGFGSTRYSTPFGASGKMRYVLEMKVMAPGRRGASDSYDLFFERGYRSRLKPGHLKVERLGK